MLQEQALINLCAKYIFTFIDDFSRFDWVYLSKNKIHVFEIFKEYIRALDQIQYGRLNKSLR